MQNESQYSPFLPSVEVKKQGSSSDLLKALKKKNFSDFKAKEKRSLGELRKFCDSSQGFLNFNLFLRRKFEK